MKTYFVLDLKVVCTPGKDNMVPDAIFHDNLATFLSQVPTISLSPTLVPQKVAEIIVEGHHDCTSVEWVRLFTVCFMKD